jgi:hypothetical protein
MYKNCPFFIEIFEVLNVQSFDVKKKNRPNIYERPYIFIKYFVYELIKVFPFLY